MNCSKSTMYLSIVAIVYMLTCALYMIATRYMPTPFADSLTASQLQLRAKSSKQRARVFGASALASLALVLGLNLHSPPPPSR